MTSILIDTNVLIYGIDKKSELHKRSKDILTHPDYNLFITTKNISEYFAVCSKLKMDALIVKGFYNDIKKNVEILYPDKNSLEIFEKLIDKYKSAGNRVYDIEIVSIMLANGVKTLATLNTKDFDQIEEIELFWK